MTVEQLLERLGAAAARRPWRTIAAWAVVAFALIALGQTVAGGFVNDFRFPGAEAQRAADLARDHVPGYGSSSAEIVVLAPGGTIAERRPTVDAMFAEIRRQPGVTDVGAPTVSPDGRAATGTVRYRGELGELGKRPYQRLQAAAGAAREAGLDVEFRGMVVDAATEPKTSASELVGLAAAMVVLLVAFGSVVAAGLPILVAVAGLLVGTAGVALVGAVVDIPTSAPIIAVMLGMGAGIDYALFVVTRFRQALAAPPERPDTPVARGGRAGRARVVAAAGQATATAGRAVLFAGGTVVVAILGLWLAGIPFIATMGLAAALIVAVMVIAALTLLPALLGLVGDRIDALRVRLPQAFRLWLSRLWPSRVWPSRLRASRSAPPGAGDATGWARWGAHSCRYRWRYAAGSVLVLLAAASPLLGLRLGAPDDGSQPSELTQRRAYDIVSDHFGPGWNGLLVVVVQGGSGEAAARLRREVAADREVEFAGQPVPSPDGAVTLIPLVPRHAPQDAEVSELVHRIRDDIAPSALGGDGVAYVGGASALVIDVADIVTERLPWVLLVVVAAAAVLLVAMFRAPLVALKAAVATLLSVGVAYGVLVAVFQWGWGLDLVGLDKPVPIMSVVPLLLFAVLFGLSMDYEVFLLSAVREAFDRGAEPRRAVVHGLASTGRVITAAAVIMALVFLSFVAIEDSLVKMVGLGLATAVVADATIIRMVLVPAVMAVLGDWAWWPRGRTGTRATPPSPTAPATAGHGCATAAGGAGR